MGKERGMKPETTILRTEGAGTESKKTIWMSFAVVT
jgi:hypothetical protein